MTCTELVVYPASETLLADASAMDKVLEAIGAAPGALDIYHGFAKDKKTVYLAIDWETIEHHKSLINSAGYADLKKTFRELVGGPPTVQHVYFNAPITKPLSTPVAEFAVATLKEGKSKDDLADIYRKNCQAGDKHSAEHPLWIWGESVEKPGTFFFVSGRETFGAYGAVKDECEKGLIGAIRELADVSVQYAELTKFNKAANQCRPTDSD